MNEETGTQSEPREDLPKETRALFEDLRALFLELHKRARAKEVRAAK